MSAVQGYPCPTCDNQKCLQTRSSVPLGENHSQLRTITLESRKLNLRKVNAPRILQLESAVSRLWTKAVWLWSLHSSLHGETGWVGSGSDSSEEVRRDGCWAWCLPEAIALQHSWNGAGSRVGIVGTAQRSRRWQLVHFHSSKPITLWILKSQRNIYFFSSSSQALRLRGNLLLLCCNISRVITQPALD